MNYWLMKSEPNAYSIDDLKQEPKQTAFWDGVRNYQARNMMRDEMKVGDQVFFYHSNCKEPGIVGIAKVVKSGYPDSTAFDPDEDHFDPKSDPDKPRWFGVDIKFIKKFKETITLTQLRGYPQLESMMILRKGNRLSVTPVTDREWSAIIAMV